VTYELNLYILFRKKLPTLWSSGQSSWLQIQKHGFDSRCYQIFWEILGLDWGPLSLVSTTEELSERKSSGFGLESREYGRRDSSRWPRGTLYPPRVGTNFADKRQSLGRYSSLRDWGQEVFLFRRPSTSFVWNSNDNCSSLIHLRFSDRSFPRGFPIIAVASLIKLYHF
jgi:hypothetical protein